MNILEQTTVALDVEFFDRANAPNVPASAFYYVVEQESGTKVVPDTTIDTLDESITITIPHAALKVPDFDGSRLFIAVVVATFGNGDRITKTYEINVGSIRGLA